MMMKSPFSVLLFVCYAHFTTAFINVCPSPSSLTPSSSLSVNLKRCSVVGGVGVGVGVGGRGNSNENRRDNNESKSSLSLSSSAFDDNIGLSGIESLSSIVPSTTKEQETVVSPFEKDTAGEEGDGVPDFIQSTFKVDEEDLDLTFENVDKVLDEIRPFLVNDGGNVNVKEIDSKTGDVYLQLEGACGSCSSSKVTMKMGIERTLKARFSNLIGNVIEVVDNDDDNNIGSTTTRTNANTTMEQQVHNEIRRISNAVIAMGGAIKILNVDSTTNEVTILYRGPSKVRKGIELALLDNGEMNVQHVNFVDDDDSSKVNKK